ncbi:gluconokinase [Actinomycetospora sp. NBRC 106378]|uniref:gluconokinase n=1 Tax=Actinomycetospora sp. NBRC 106378 TaxID=3032208 RepID=UPI0024A5B6DF|nr:gluconokinase [Actinomycetospora sp. NBRC 106378]GLZ56013.1 gluconate kinase [Actinomycetospora sp. NBRC 106378]
MSSDPVLAVDVGTTSTKAVLFTTTGAVLGEGDRGYALAEPEPGAAVQDPETVWEAVGDAVRDAVGAAGGRRPQVVAFSAAMHGLLGVDDAGDPVGPLLTWADSRAGDVAGDLRRRDDALALHRRTGTPIHSMSPLVKLAWLRRERPSLHAAPARWSGIKEFVVGRAGGRRAADASCASGTGLMDLERRCWDDEALDLAGLTADRLDPIVDTTAVVGKLSAAAAREWDLPSGTPLVAGAGDGPLANLGLGAVRPGVLACSIGTSGALRLAVDRPGIDPRGRLFCYELTRDRWVVGGAVTNGGVVLDWASETFGADPDTLLTEAAATPPGADGLLAIPHLLAERAPRWDGGLGGTFLNLQRAHGRGHLTRALLEGVCLQLRLVLDSVRDAGMAVGEIRATGGFARSDFWRQLLADVLGMPVGYAEGHQGSAYGAALLGMQAVGLLEDTPDALADAADHVTIAETLEPGPSAAGHTRRRDLVERVHDQLAEVVGELRS